MVTGLTKDFATIKQRETIFGDRQSPPCILNISEDGATVKGLHWL